VVVVGDATGEKGGGGQRGARKEVAGEKEQRGAGVKGTTREGVVEEGGGWTPRREGQGQRRRVDR